MKNLFALIIALAFITCSKKNNTACAPVSPSAESGKIVNFCNTNGITYTVDSNGIYYQVITPGSGTIPTINSVITVTYTTATLDGKVLEDKSTTPVTLPLNQFIEGWRLAIPYIQQGGHIKMVLPSSLAYGCTGISNFVAPNSPLYYDVILIDVQ